MTAYLPERREPWRARRCPRGRLERREKMEGDAHAEIAGWLHRIVRCGARKLALPPDLLEEDLTP